MGTLNKTAVLQEEKILEVLSLQAQSFQEGFETLLKCRSTKEMASVFSRLLKGNFILKEISVLAKKSTGSQWEDILHSAKLTKDDFDHLTDGAEYRISYFEDGRFSAAVTLPLSDGTALGILIGRKMDGSIITLSDRITLQILLQVYNSAHKAFISQKRIKKLIFDLNEKVLQLNNLIDAGIELSKFEKRDMLYQTALERVSSITNSSAALILIKPKTGSLQEQFFTFPDGLNPEDILNFSERIESSFELNDKIYRLVLSGKESRTGTEQFNDLDKILLDAITRQISASLENEFWHNESVEKERIQKELNLAALIQQQIIPDMLPSIEGYDLAAMNIPSQEVGGDYYDCIKTSDHNYAFIIADVAGKGISAALLVNTLHAALNSYLQFNLPLQELADKLNRLIFDSSPSDKYITFFIAVLDASTGKLNVLNAGHNPAFIMKGSGEIEELKAGGVGLGMFDFGIPFKGKSLLLEKGDTLFLYTDGIPEAMNKLQEEYSDERMVEFFRNNSYMCASDFVDSIISDVRNHTDGFPQSDDITLLFLKKN